MDRVSVVRGDITTADVDAVVNAANSALIAGGGVCGAIHAAAGPRLAQACAEIGQCAPGDAVTTDGFDLPAAHVIHAVGPRWAGGDASEDETLASCYRAILREADAVGARSVAIPAISTGIYGFPLERACRIAATTLLEALPGTSVRDVQLFAYDSPTSAALAEALRHDQ